MISVPIHDLLVTVPDYGGEAFEVTHEPCGVVLLFTQRVHLETLIKIAIEHDCQGGN